MSSAMRAALVFLLCVVAQRSRSQTPSSLEMARHAVSESYARVEAMLADMRQDSVRRFALPVGRRYAGMVVHVDTTLMAEHFMRALDDAFSSALKDVVAVIGPRAHGLMTGMNATIMRGGATDTPEQQLASRFVSFRTDPTGTRGFWYQTAQADPPGDDVIRNLVLQWFSSAAFDRMPAGIRSWMGQVISFDRPRVRMASARYQTYRELARADKKSSRACLEGALRACRSLLSIEPGNDTVATWLDAAERRDMVAKMGRYGRDYVMHRFARAGIATYDRCVRGGGDDACRVALRVTDVRAPIGSTSRVNLLMLAIARGGPDAYGRLESTKATDIGDILATTAGVPLDTLIAEWRTTLMTAEPRSPAPDAREILISAVLCIGALAVCVGRRI